MSTPIIRFALGGSFVLAAVVTVVVIGIHLIQSQQYEEDPYSSSSRHKKNDDTDDTNAPNDIPVVSPASHPKGQAQKTNNFTKQRSTYEYSEGSSDNFELSTLPPPTINAQKKNDNVPNLIQLEEQLEQRREKLRREQAELEWEEEQFRTLKSLSSPSNASLSNSVNKNQNFLPSSSQSTASLQPKKVEAETEPLNNLLFESPNDIFDSSGSSASEAFAPVPAWSTQSRDFEKLDEVESLISLDSHDNHNNDDIPSEDFPNYIPTRVFERPPEVDVANISENRSLSSSFHSAVDHSTPAVLEADVQSVSDKENSIGSWSDIGSVKSSHSQPPSPKLDFI